MPLDQRKGLMIKEKFQGKVSVVVFAVKFFLVIARMLTKYDHA